MANVATLTYAGRTMLWLRQKGVGAEGLFAQWGTGNGDTGAANANVNLFAPATEARATGVTSILTTNFLGDTYKNIATITCAVGGKTITEVGYFDTSTASGTTTVNFSMTAGVTTITLGATSPITSGNFYAQVDLETLLCTGAASATLTITRGALGSTGAGHAVGAPFTVGGDGGAAANGATSSQTATVGATQGGNCFLHADHGGVALNVNDSISYTTTVTLT